MKIIKSIQEVKSLILEQKMRGLSIGFVPTMGYLHEGHVSLIREAREKSDYVVLSIFVNPLQFGPNEDFDRYPRDLEKDSSLARENKVDLLFHPTVEEIYPTYPSQTIVSVQGLTKQLCGASRPGHFDGVTTVVNKLFNIVQPDTAFFGLKDAQQVAVITQMVKDLNIPIEIVPCPIIREEDGLAKSSRNIYLNQEERKQAVVLSQSLEYARELLQSGERDVKHLIAAIKSRIAAQHLAQIDYVEILKYPDLSTINKLYNETIIIALAIKFGNTRLIDNCIVELGS